MPDENDVNEEEKNMDPEEVQREMARLLTSVKDMTMYNLSVLASQAWHHLGLSPAPGTEKAEVDLDQAKMAIDLFEANLGIIGEKLEKEVLKEFKRTLMDLQLNYVNRSK